MTSSYLTLERRDQHDPSNFGGVALTPPISKDFWTYRVWLSGQQAMLGFPKFNTIGIGFAVEQGWNTNLPYTCNTEEIFEHIKDNLGDCRITREECLEAIRLIQAAATEDRGEAETVAERARIYGNGGAA